jgi:polar amino acid transport system substrate-binding protein
MKTRTRLLGILLGAVLAVAGFAAQAQTVNDIVKRGKVRIGVNSGAPPFSVIDQNGKPVGYDVDVANLIAKYLGVPVEITPYTTAARIPALEADKVDFVVATLSPTPERAKVVMFTMPYSTFRLVVIAPKNSPIKKIEDLAGKKVGVSRGTPQEVALAQSAPKGTVFARFDDDSTTMQAMVGGQVQAIAIPETVFLEVLKAQPNSNLQIKFPFFNQFMSIAVRRDSFELRQWLNTTLSFIKQDGSLDEIAKKWTGHTLPANMPVF